jgi:hypothetical protein
LIKSSQAVLVIENASIIVVVIIIIIITIIIFFRLCLPFRLGSFAIHCLLHQG